MDIKDMIKEGYIIVDDVKLSEETTIEDLEKVGLDKAVIRTHPRGFAEIIFNHPIEADSVTFQVSMRVTKNARHRVILLDPKLKRPIFDALDSSKEKQEICEEWLKRNMDVPPTRDTDAGIFYDFPWGHIHSTAAEHINFGHLQGCIQITYGEDME